MKKVLIIFIFCFINFSLKASCDTISFVKVYLNDSLVFKGNMLFGSDFELKKSNLSMLDTLHVEYFDDTPCYNCESYIELRNNENRLIKTYSGLDTFSRKSVPIFDILPLRYKSLYIWYYEGSSREKSMLFNFTIV